VVASSSTPLVTLDLFQMAANCTELVDTWSPQMAAAEAAAAAAKASAAQEVCLDFVDEAVGEWQQGMHRSSHHCSPLNCSMRWQWVPVTSRHCLHLQ